MPRPDLHKLLLQFIYHYMSHSNILVVADILTEDAFVDSDV
jgi:hypothetical protein